VANVYATKSGNWSDPTVWNTGALPTAADDVRSNTFTVTINAFEETITPGTGITLISLATGRYQVSKVRVFKNTTTELVSGTDFTATDGQTITLIVAANGTDSYTIRNNSWQVLTISNRPETGIARNGTFIINDEVILTGTNILNPDSAGGVSTVIQISVNSPKSCVINANFLVTNGSRDSGLVATIAGSGTTTINGNITRQGSAGFTNANVRYSGTGVLNVNGDIGQNSSNNQDTTALNNQFSGTINIVGNIFGVGAGGNGDWIVYNSSSGVINITSALISGVSKTKVFNASTGTINILSSEIRGDSAEPSINNNSTGTINITSSSLTGVTGYALTNNSSGIVNHTGIVVANGSPAINVGSSTQTTILTGPFLCASNGVQACVAQRWRLNAATASTYLEVQTNNLAIKRNLYTAQSVGGNPAVANVRLGTTYGPTDELIGSCAIPPLNAVQSGVPVDDTFGTGDFGTNAQGFWDTPASELAAESPEGSIGRRMANAPTAELIGEYLAAFDRV
jgi:hypothetical protein